MRCRLGTHRYLNMLPSLALMLGCQVLVQVLISQMSSWTCTKFLLYGLLWFPLWLKVNSRSALQLLESSSIKAIFLPFLLMAFRKLIHPKIPCQLSINTTPTEQSVGWEDGLWLLPVRCWQLCVCTYANDHDHLFLCDDWSKFKTSSFFKGKEEKCFFPFCWV